MSKRKSVPQYFSEVFSSASLHEIYNEKISTSKTVGRDGIRTPAFSALLDANIEIILKKVHECKYAFSSYKEFLISKGRDSNPRVISIATVRDRLVLKALTKILSHAFYDVTHKRPHEYIKRITDISRDNFEGYSYLRLDVKSYYPSINHRILLSRIRSRIRCKKTIALIVDAISAPTGTKRVGGNVSEIGVPQGLSISNLLAAIFLSKFDIEHSNRTDYFYFRYVDDILIVCPTSNVEQVYRTIFSQLLKLKLKCHPISEMQSGKSKICSVKDGIDYLGYTISHQPPSIRKSSYRKMFMNLSKVFTKYKYNQYLDTFIIRLNLKITGCIFENKRLGWMFYFSQTDDINQLQRLDFFVLKMLRKRNLIEHRNRIKSFVKTYHEIRYNLANSQYIPIFDNYSQDEKIDFICRLEGKSRPVVEAWDVQLIEATFLKLVRRETSTLEKDLIDNFS